eukprot:scaffold7381_cov310-Pinguiococcus_pyrenoidosus.AAC.51
MRHALLKGVFERASHVCRRHPSEYSARTLYSSRKRTCAPSAPATEPALPRTSPIQPANSCGEVRCGSGGGGGATCGGVRDSGELLRHRCASVRVYFSASFSTRSGAPRSAFQVGALRGRKDRKERRARRRTGRQKMSDSAHTNTGLTSA